MPDVIFFTDADISVLFASNSIALILFLFLFLSLQGISLVSLLKKILEPRHNINNFLNLIKQGGSLLDVGCGNNSPYKIKSRHPDIIYTGIDVGDYNQIKPNLADNYIVVEPDRFAQAISEMPERFDALISSHNLEHCNDRQNTLDSMIKALKPNGYMYLSFPTEESINFPGPRKGTLNYYDDPTHKDIPPGFNETLDTLKKNNMEILFASKSYKPLLLRLLGFMLEWKSKKDKEVKYSTWAYWGFEAIIWAKKKAL